MVKLHIGVNNLTIVLHKDFLVFSVASKSNEWVFKKFIKCEENLKDLSDGAIECCTFSSCGKYFGVNYDKSILIYDTSSWNILFVSSGERKSSCLRFFPKSSILVCANKSGSAIFYSFAKNKLEKIDKILGHNSMLTGTLVTDDEKFIITCDRDDKIRVSNYPNIYNIQNYCLGHTKFITWIGFLPSDNNILVSSSGDGTLKFWDYKFGKEIASYDSNTAIKNDLNDKSSTVIYKVACCQVDSASILAFLVYNSNRIQILRVTQDVQGVLCFEMLSLVTLPCVPWDAEFYNEYLINLLPNINEPLMFWSVKDNKFVKNESFHLISDYVSTKIDMILGANWKIPDNIPILFKRDTDNIQEYEQRKKARLLKTGRTS